MAIPRLFTLEQAERTLPLVRRIVEDLVQVYPEWRAGVARYEALSLDARPEAGGTAKMIAEQDRARERQIDENRSAAAVRRGADANAASKGKRK